MIGSIHPSSFAVKEYREKHSVGLDQARRILTKQNALQAIREAESLEQLKHILVEVVEEFI